MLQEASGNINVENFTQDESPNEYDINLTGSASNDGEQKIKEEASKAGVKVLSMHTLSRSDNICVCMYI